jgi:hypothetical protein
MLIRMLDMGRLAALDWLTGHWADPWVARGIFIFLGAVTSVFLVWHWRTIKNQAHRSDVNADSELSAKHAPSENTANNPLSIEFLQDDLHDIVQILPGGTVRRMLKVSTINRGNGWLSNCRLSVEQTAPPIYNNAIELERGFTLQAGERRYSYFLYFDERFPSGDAAPKVLLAHQSAGFLYVEIGFSTTQSTIFILKATSDGRESKASFRAFVENGRLRMEKL